MTATTPAAIASAQVELGSENDGTIFLIKIFSFKELGPRAIAYGFVIIVVAIFQRTERSLGISSHLRFMPCQVVFKRTSISLGEDRHVACNDGFMWLAVRTLVAIILGASKFEHKVANDQDTPAPIVD